MTGPWIVAFAGLVVLVIALAILMLGVLARVDRALDEIASRLPRHPNAVGGLEVGQVPPVLDFEMPELDGPVRFRRSVVIFAAKSCSPCESLLADLAARPVDTNEWARVLVWDAAEEAPGAVPSDWLIISADGAAALRKLFQVQATPYGVVVDDDGRVAAVGIPNKADDVRRLLETAERWAATPHPQPAPKVRKASTQPAASTR